MSAEWRPYVSCHLFALLCGTSNALTHKTDKMTNYTNKKKNENPFRFDSP